MWPTQAEVLSNKSVYGNPRGKGGGVVSIKWYNENIVMLRAPWAMTMGPIKITRLAVHRLVADSLERVFADIFRAADEDYKILQGWGVTKFGGTFNYRPMRGLSSLSMHSYGCAIDLDPENNGLGDRTPRFEKILPVRDAFMREGWKWGGDWNGNGSVADERRPDGMHWQATR